MQFPEKLLLQLYKPSMKIRFQWKWIQWWFALFLEQRFKNSHSNRIKGRKHPSNNKIKIIYTGIWNKSEIAVRFPVKSWLSQVQFLLVSCSETSRQFSSSSLWLSVLQNKNPSSLENHTWMEMIFCFLLANIAFILIDFAIQLIIVSRAFHISLWQKAFRTWVWVEWLLVSKWVIW